MKNPLDLAYKGILYANCFNPLLNRDELSIRVLKAEKKRKKDGTSFYKAYQDLKEEEKTQLEINYAKNLDRVRNCSQSELTDLLFEHAKYLTDNSKINEKPYNHKILKKIIKRIEESK